MLSRQDLWPLSFIVQESCSNDKTKHEDFQDPILQHVSSAVHIKNLPWGSSDLQHVVTRLDVYKGKIDSSTPRRRSSESMKTLPTGRPARPRIRCKNACVSQISAPTGLPIDCYSAEWLCTLSSLSLSQLEINPERALSCLIPIANSLYIFQMLCVCIEVLMIQYCMWIETWKYHRLIDTKEIVGT